MREGGRGREEREDVCAYRWRLAGIDGDTHLTVCLFVYCVNPCISNQNLYNLAVRIKFHRAVFQSVSTSSHSIGTSETMLVQESDYRTRPESLKAGKEVYAISSYPNTRRLSFSKCKIFYALEVIGAAEASKVDSGFFS